MHIMSESTNGVPNEDYPSVKELPDTEEITKLTDYFQKKFNGIPDFYVRVPGRVNLIGEHVDYCGYSVCPMAVQQHILVALKISDDSVVRISNVDEKYKEYKGQIDDIRISVNGIPEWYQYYLCGVKGALDCLLPEIATKGFYAAVSGNIPPSSGLSSSSALVSAALLATCKAFQLELTKSKLANLAAKCERYIGTQGGGMDQAIAFLATEGCAKLISFSPLTSEDVQLPEGAVFVIANSLEEMNKAATQDFNQRVIECRLVCQVLAKRMRLDWKKIRTLIDLQQIVGLGIRHLRALAMETLHDKPYTKDEICREFQVTKEELDKISMTENTKDIQEFKLKQRLLHVTQEVERVQEFIRICKECASGKISPESGLWSLGNLMKKSHESLKTLYECSHEQLDKIVDIAEKNTLGGRLTGAGWGGCTVALTTKETADKYITALKEEFYAENPKAQGKDLDNVVFATQPGPGATIYVKS